MRKKPQLFPGKKCLFFQGSVAGRFLLPLLFSLISLTQQTSVFAQDSSHIRISLLTCTPGEELYSTFGHTAIRVTDSNSVNDIVFNYGTFNFDAPGFYTKFIRGKLLYYLSAERFDDFKAAYQQDNRGITEQLLNLDTEEKIAITEALYENVKPENSSYKYDFFFDNCTTRPRDLLLKIKKHAPPFNPVMPVTTTFRQAIHLYLDKNNKDWSKFGIDLLLAAPTDAVMTVEQSQFLPDNLMKTLDSSNANLAWVTGKKDLYDFAMPEDAASYFTPAITFSLLFLVVFFLSFSTNKQAKVFLQGFDGFFFFLLGVFGCLFIFMWTSTDHLMCRNNYNLLWAWPMHLIMSIFAYNKHSFVRKYFTVTAVVGVLLLLVWFFLPQQLNPALIPIQLLIILRAYFISRSNKYFKDLLVASH